MSYELIHLPNSRLLYREIFGLPYDWQAELGQLERFVRESHRLDFANEAIRLSGLLADALGENGAQVRAITTLVTETLQNQITALSGGELSGLQRLQLGGIGTAFLTQSLIAQSRGDIPRGTSQQLQGAGAGLIAGAGIGTAIVPGLGTGIGGLLGALFGSGVASQLGAVSDFFASIPGLGRLFRGPGNPAAQTIGVGQTVSQVGGFENQQFFQTAFGQLVGLASEGTRDVSENAARAIAETFANVDQVIFDAIQGLGVTRDVRRALIRQDTEGGVGEISVIRLIRAARQFTEGSARELFADINTQAQNATQLALERFQEIAAVAQSVQAFEERGAAARQARRDIREGLTPEDIALRELREEFRELRDAAREAGVETRGLREAFDEQSKLLQRERREQVELRVDAFREETKELVRAQRDQQRGVGPVRSALRGIREEFQELRKAAEEAGLGVDKLRQSVRRRQATPPPRTR